MDQDLLVARGICKSFAGVQALHDVSITIRRGEIRCLVGENGSGKSTFIKIIAGVHAPDAGEVVVNGRYYRKLTPIDAIREGIQVIYQDFSLFPNLTVAENVALNYELARNRRLVNWREVRKVAGEAIRRIGFEVDLDTRVETLSVAEKQLTAISRALLYNAQLIVMDEPTTALTQKEVEALFRVVRNLKQQGISVLFVSHKLNEVMEIADCITVLRNGEKVADGDSSEFDWAKLTYFMTGKELRETHYECPPRESGTTSLLKVEHLSRKGSFSDVSFEVFPGEIVGITGLLGSGRTELAMTLFGLRPADAGVISVNGEPVRMRSPQDAIRRGIAYVPEDRLTQGLFLTQPIGKNILATIIGQFRHWLKMLDLRSADAEADSWIRRMNIMTPSARLPAQSLSGGNQQRVVLAKWLATSPRILVLNGPTVGIDVGSKADIHAMIRDLAKQGVGVLIISDDIPELLQNCNRILLMRKGKIVGEFTSTEITEDELARKLVGA